MQGAGDLLDGDIAGGAGGGIAGAEHFAFAGGLEVAVKLLVEPVASDGGARECFVCGQRRILHIECSFSVHRNWAILRSGLGVREPELKRESAW